MLSSQFVHVRNMLKPIPCIRYTTKFNCSLLRYYLFTYKHRNPMIIKVTCAVEMGRVTTREFVILKMDPPIRFTDCDFNRCNYPIRITDCLFHRCNYANDTVICPCFSMWARVGACGQTTIWHATFSTRGLHGGWALPLGSSAGFRRRVFFWVNFTEQNK